jgi:hypothetical protein
MTQPREVRIHISRLVVDRGREASTVSNPALVAEAIRDAIGTRLSDRPPGEPVGSQETMPAAVAREVLGHDRVRRHVGEQLGGGDARVS